MNFVEKIMLKMISHKVSRWFEMERTISKLDGATTSVLTSPAKSWPDLDKIPLGKEVPFNFKNILLVGKHLKNCISEGMKAISSISDNPKTAKMTITADELRSFEVLTKELGIDIVGYCNLPRHLIFKDRAVLYNYAIILAKEMDKEAIMNAPSVSTFKMVMSTYDTLGIITNQITKHLRNKGFQAQASHPLGGLAVEAGLGWFGRHGLLITPQFGARQRLSAIFVNIENLPLNTENNHTWIEDFCNKCGKCIRTCPGNAILHEPIEHPSGRKTCIERDKCLTEFVNNQGCTICIRDCVFTHSNYDKLHLTVRQEI